MEEGVWPRLHERNIIVPADKKNIPCYCIYGIFILLQIIGNDIISDAINMITLDYYKET